MANIDSVPLGRWIIFIAPFTPCIFVRLKTGMTLACPLVLFMMSDS